MSMGRLVIENSFFTFQSLKKMNQTQTNAFRNFNFLNRLKYDREEQLKLIEFQRKATWAIYKTYFENNKTELDSIEERN